MVLVIVLRWEFVPRWLAILCFVGWVLKDLVMYPFLRLAYEPGVTGYATLVGSRGRAEGDLAPTGYIRVRGELWRAVVSPADVVIPSGTEVEIVSAERMEVSVRPVDTSAKGGANSPGKPS